jgi:hypothetical protein
LLWDKKKGDFRGFRENCSENSVFR